LNGLLKKLEQHPGSDCGSPFVWEAALFDPSGVLMEYWGGLGDGVGLEISLGGGAWTADFLADKLDFPGFSCCVDPRVLSYDDPSCGDLASNDFADGTPPSFVALVGVFF